MLPAGRLREQITIQQPVEAQDEHSGTLTTWETFAIARAEVKPLSGREFWAAQATQSETTTQMRIRYAPGITTKMRVVWREAEYGIQSVIPDERWREITLMCVERG